MISKRLQRPLNKLKRNIEGFPLYQAGLPNFPRNFTRDSLYSVFLLLENCDNLTPEQQRFALEMLENQLRFCSEKQGITQNPNTGEEPGKIFHEYPGFVMPQNGLSTLYNACDTTALYLIGHRRYQELTGNTRLIDAQQDNIRRAVEYIFSHIGEDGIFWEDPAHCGAKEFGLKVSYWKDSNLLDRREGKPSYPIVYPLAHAQNLAGLRSASRLLPEDDQLQPQMREKIAAMRVALTERLFDEDTEMFYLAIDQEGEIPGISTDGLHALYFLEQDDLSKEKIQQIAMASECLETPWGYRVLDSTAAKRNQTTDDYHANTLWCWEQAIIHAGAKKFGLEKPQEVSARVVPALGYRNAEILQLREQGFDYAGCDPQLWTIAAKDYFARQGIVATPQVLLFFNQALTKFYKNRK